MDNYFEIATQKEIEEALWSGDPNEAVTQEEIQEKQESYAKYPDLNNEALFLLFVQRGEDEKAKIYLEKIQDPEIQLCASMLAYELREF